MPSNRTRPKPPFEGFAIAASFWLWGLLAVYSTSYLDAGTYWHPLAFGIGGILLSVGLLGSMVELSRLARGEAWSWWAVGTVFLVPAVALGMVLATNSFPANAETGIKVVVLLLAFFAGPFFFIGVAHFVSPSEGEPAVASGHDGRSLNMELAASLIVAVLSITAAALRFPLEFAQ